MKISYILLLLLPMLALSNARLFGTRRGFRASHDGMYVSDFEDFEQTASSLIKSSPFPTASLSVRENGLDKRVIETNRQDWPGPGLTETFQDDSNAAAAELTFRNNFFQPDEPQKLALTFIGSTNMGTFEDSVAETPGMRLMSTVIRYAVRSVNDGSPLQRRRRAADQPVDVKFWYIAGHCPGTQGCHLQCRAFDFRTRTWTLDIHVPVSATETTATCGFHSTSRLVALFHKGEGDAIGSVRLYLPLEITIESYNGLDQTAWKDNLKQDLVSATSAGESRIHVHRVSELVQGRSILATVDIREGETTSDLSSARALTSFQDEAKKGDSGALERGQIIKALDLNEKIDWKIMCRGGDYVRDETFCGKFLSDDARLAVLRNRVDALRVGIVLKLLKRNIETEENFNDQFRSDIAVATDIAIERVHIGWLEEKGMSKTTVIFFVLQSEDSEEATAEEVVEIIEDQMLYDQSLLLTGHKTSSVDASENTLSAASTVLVLCYGAYTEQDSVCTDPNAEEDGTPFGLPNWAPGVVGLGLVIVILVVCLKCCGKKKDNGANKKKPAAASPQQQANVHRPSISQMSQISFIPQQQMQPMMQMTPQHPHTAIPIQQQIQHRHSLAGAQPVAMNQQQAAMQQRYSLSMGQPMMQQNGMGQQHRKSTPMVPQQL